MKFPLTALLLVLFFPFYIKSQPTPPCGLDYGVPGDREAIQLAMFSGNQQDVIQAINAAKLSRGTLLGCPQQNYGPYAPSDTTAPGLAEAVNIWNSLYRPELESYQIDCPSIARGMPSFWSGSLPCKTGRLLS